ncbi:MAG TPA: OmpA family protein [Puia sp.]|nr:OmpA family protein [Puia sp.]
MNFKSFGRLLLLLILLHFFSAPRAQVRLAAMLGVHSSSFPESNSIPGFDTARGNYFSSKTGAQFGVIAEIPLGKSFFLQPGLNYSSKGNQYQRFYDSAAAAATDTQYDQHTLKLNYMEVPVILTYKLPLSKNKPQYFFLGAGPYFAFIIAANQPYQNRVKFYGDDDYTYQSGTTDLPVGNGVGKYKTFDLGLQARAGFELGSVMLSAYFSRGLTNAYQADYPASFHNQVFGASLAVWLNKVKTQPPPVVDSDQDGTPDPDDSCKTIAGVPKYHGCPIPDTDADGVNDEQDSCRTLAGTVKYHGCPIPDSDGDGVNDEEDSCRTVAGVAKYHGCPVPDTDGDGVNDEKDLCPNLAGSPENNGCPVVKPEPVPAPRILYIAQNVQFRSSSSRLTSGSLPALKELADTLKASPDLDLVVEGHADNSGSAVYNQKLSEQRAGEVKKALVKLGIPADRITTIGYGDTRPVADNKTAAGKAKNRRVVLTLHPKNS